MTKHYKNIYKSLILKLIFVHKKEFEKLKNRTRFSMRIDAELHALLKQRSKGNLTAYVENLMVKGITVDINDMYRTALNITNNTIKTTEQNEIRELKKSNEEIKKELSTQSKVLINFCKLEGVTTDELTKLSSDIGEGDDYKSIIRFHNRLLLKLAVLKGHTMENIKNWINNS